MEGGHGAFRCHAERVSIEIDQGGIGNHELVAPLCERVALVGPSGAGKSTLGRLMAGVDGPRTGTITVGGADLGRAPDLSRVELLSGDPVTAITATPSGDRLFVAMRGMPEFMTNLRKACFEMRKWKNTHANPTITDNGSNAAAGDQEQYYSQQSCYA